MVCGNGGVNMVFGVGCFFFLRIGSIGRDKRLAHQIFNDLNVHVRVNRTDS